MIWNRFILLLFVGTTPLLWPSEDAYCQSDSRVDWSTFDMGLAISTSPNTSLISVVGQPIAGEARQSNTVVLSGFSGYFGRQSLFITSADTPNVNTNSRVKISVATGGIRILSGELFYRMAGREVFSSVPIDTATLEADIPASAVTIRGVEYYALLNTDIGPQTYPKLQPSTHPDIIRVKVMSTPYGSSPPSVPPPQPFQPRMYRMISVPLDFASLSGSAMRISSLLGDDYGTYRPNLWRVFHWETNASGETGYDEFQGILSNVQPGIAFWLITYGGEGFDSDSALSVVSNADYAITLAPGWNQIANPYAYPVAWDTVYTVAGGPVGLPYFFDGQQLEYLDSVAVLNPWEGYFVFNSDPANSATIRIPTVDTTVRPPRLGKPDHPPGYIVNIAAHVDGTRLVDSRNSIGFFEGASNKTDLYDVPEPPPLPEILQLSIVDSGSHFMRNYKAANTEGQLWDLQVTSPVSGKGVRVSLDAKGQRPKGFDLYVLDMDQASAIGLTDSTFDLFVKGSSDIRQLRVIIGTKEFAEKNSDGIPLVPLEYSLDQNFPNPFNPTTTIRYQLSKLGRTTLEIFNILGQRVRTLVDEEQKAGAYTVVWEGENNAGLRVASGVYLYRIRSGDFTITKKMILMR